VQLPVCADAERRPVQVAGAVHPSLPGHDSCNVLRAFLLSLSSLNTEPETRRNAPQRSEVLSARFLAVGLYEDCASACVRRCQKTFIAYVIGVWTLAWNCVVQLFCSTRENTALSSARAVGRPACDSVLVHARRQPPLPAPPCTHRVPCGLRPLPRRLQDVFNFC